MPYRHLDSYLRCWLDPETNFGRKKILTVGAGESTYSRLIADQFNPCILIASDLIVERMLPAARTNLIQKIHFVGADGFNLPFRAATFDVVFGSLVLCQLPELQRIINEVSRVLTEDGCYIGIEPNPFYLIHLMHLITGKGSPNNYLLTPKHIRLFESSGFQVSIRFFSGRFPLFKSPILTTCMGIVAKRVKINERASQ